MVNLEPQDINLEKFLKRFTFQGDPDAGTKQELPMIDFLNIASKLKVDLSIQNLQRALR